MHGAKKTGYWAGAFGLALSAAACGDAEQSQAKVRSDVTQSTGALNHGKAWLDRLGRPSRGYKLNRYGSWLQTNKRHLVKVLRDHGASHEELVAVVAVAMQETQHMDGSERDASKDSHPGAANLSCLNMNMDMLRRVGYAQHSGPDLNRNEHLFSAAGYALKAIRKLTLNGFLAFHRAGSTGYDQFRNGGQDGYKRNDYMDVQGYIDGFVTIAYQLETQPELLKDDRRVDVYVEHRLAP